MNIRKRPQATCDRGGLLPNNAGSYNAPKTFKKSIKVYIYHFLCREIDAFSYAQLNGNIKMTVFIVGFFVTLLSIIDSFSVFFKIKKQTCKTHNKCSV